MSRHLEKVEGDFKETIDDMTKCRWLYDEICCNPLSDKVADFPNDDYCQNCLQFTKERDRRNGTRKSKIKLYGS